MLRGSAGRRDERSAMIDVSATAFAGHALIAVVIGLWVVDVARGNDGMPTTHSAPWQVRLHRGRRSGRFASSHAAQPGVRLAGYADDRRSDGIDSTATAGRFHLEVDGQACGFLRSINGGSIKARS